ncbi:SIR2 family protein [Bradyrhizobium sediminis]|uniref:SIR2 family protein n=1 Tax=Bradyrhizobium sediminis TaxID=2840469 RepID=A0A975RSD5_9BRAD|nr:SIR2 family protein [Bradyrhizobium sediminis]QWG17909.1 SIR2 family protein [Bradyrhizobium sediminis]
MIQWPDQLVTDIARRRAVLMIGSGISRHSVGQNGSRPPTWHGFLEAALDQCEPKPPHIKKAIQRGQYLDACEWLKKHIDDGWVPFLRQSFVEPKFQTAEIHKLLYQLDCRIVLTPNFDLIYDGYAVSESQQTILVKNYDDADIIDGIRRNDRLVLKAHGSIHEPAKMIFTRSDYALARTKYAGFYSLLDALVNTNTVLIVGAGLDDPDFQLLFEDSAAEFSSGLPHYMTSGDNFHADMIATIRQTRNIKTLAYSPKKNHAELVASLTELVKLVGDKRVLLTRTMDW